MAPKSETSKSSSSTQPKNVIQAPTRNPARANTEIPVDTTQSYDDSNEPKGIGKAGFKKPGDKVTRTARHEARAKSK